MNNPYHFGSPAYAALKQEAKVKELIRDLERVVRILEVDIATEEARAGVSDPCNGAYPILARKMMARRDNLKETIAALERQLAREAAVAG
jgi:hypothetical protein